MSNIPEDKLPDYWKNEDRINALYAPFRSRTVNPKDWDTKLASWKTLIALYCMHNGIYSFSLAALNKAFIRNGRPPSGLNLVVEEMLKTGELQSMNQFFQKTSQTWGGWAADIFVKRPISWSYNSIKRSLFAPNSVTEIYVHVEVIQMESVKLLASVPEKYKDKVISSSEFLQITGKNISQIDSIKLLLHYLINEGKVVLTNLKNGSNSSDFETSLIKCSDLSKVKPISETEIGIHTLQQSEKIFLSHIEHLEDDMGRYRIEAKSRLTKGHRQLAKNCLRKMHEIEKRIAKKIDALHNVQVLLSKLQDLHITGHVLNSYKEALSAFNNTLEANDLTEETVEDTMSKLRDMLDIHEDIQSSLAQPVLETDEDLEKELAELMEADETEKASTNNELKDIESQLEKLNIESLPDVPSSNVSSQEISLN